MRVFFISVLLIILFFFQPIFLGKVWYCCDNLLINIPARVFQMEELRKVTFPLDNPYIFSGTLFLADINLAALYPGNIFFWFFDNPFRALTMAIIFHFFLAFTGMYVLTRSMVSAIVFSFSGTLITYTNNLPMLQVAALLPWVLWAWNRNFVLFVVIASMQIFAGHAQLIYYTWLLLIAHVLSFGSKKIWSLFGAIVLIALITLPQTLPFLQFARASTRSTFGYEYAVFDSLSPLAVMRLIIPWSVGILNEGTAWAMGGSVYGYVGVLPLLLALAAPRRNAVVRFFLIVTVVSFITALGKYTPIYPLLYRIVPGLGSFRSPQHFLLLYSFSVAVLSGFGLDRAKRLRPGLLIVVAIGLLLVGFFTLFLFGTRLFDPFFPQKLVSKFALDPGVWPTVMRLILLNTGLSAIIVSLFYKYRNGVLIYILVFIDLFIFTRSNIITEPQAAVESWFTKSDALVRSIEPGGKIYVHKDLYPARYRKQFGKNQLPDEAAWQVAILRPNINMLYHLPSIDGYASIVSRKYQDSFGVPATDPTGVNVGEITGKKLIERGVNTVLAPPDPKYIQELFPLMLSQWQPSMAIYRERRK